MRSTVEEHLRWCEDRNLRPIYITNRKRIIARMDRELGKALEDVTEAELLLWHRGVVQTLTPQSRGVLLSHIANYCRWLVREGRRADDPTIRIDRPRLRRRLPRPITDDHLARALADAPTRARPWLHLAAFAGLRAMEIAGLRAEDVREDLNPPVIIVNVGKGNTQRIVPLHPTLAAVLHEHELPTQGPLFLNAAGSGPVKPHIVSRVCNRYLHALEIPDTAHSLRHWFGTSVYRASKDLRLTQELMGHADPSTTAGYAAWSAEKSTAVVARLQVAPLDAA